MKSPFSERIIAMVYSARIPLALMLGAIDAWGGRGSFMAGDTVSYMDMAHAIASGNWHAAINGYWSPLYPLYLSLFLHPFLSEPAAQFAAVRLANFLIFGLTLGLFEHLLKSLADRVPLPISMSEGVSSALPRKHFVVGAYAAFLWASLSLNMVARISPDNLVLTSLVLTAILLLKLETARPDAWHFALFGLALGIGYWIKAILFPAGLIILAGTLFSTGIRRRKSLLLVSTMTFMALALPLLVAISIHCGRITFGETGRLNYAWYVNMVPRELHWGGNIPGQGTPLHSTRMINSKPDVFEFGTPLVATYPPWAEPSYWYEGVRTHLDIRQQSYACLANSARILLILVKTFFLPVLIVILLISWRKCSPRQELFREMNRLVCLWVAALGIISLYLCVFLLDRHVAGTLLLVAVLLIALIRVNNSKWATGLVLLLVATSMASVLPRMTATSLRIIAQRGNTHDHRWKVAEEFARLHLPAHIPVASIGGVAFDDWAYPAQARVVTEIVGYNNRKRTGDVEQFWGLDLAGRNRILALMGAAGAKVVICNELPPGSDPVGWTRINDSPYIYQLLH